MADMGPVSHNQCVALYHESQTTASPVAVEIGGCKLHNLYICRVLDPEIKMI